jgi:methionyl-tRNA synthetase
MVSFEDFKKLEIKTAKILDVINHPNADKLFILKIDIGGEKKQIVAGIRKQYSKEELIGKDIVVVNNLEPIVIRGEESKGMLLAAQDENIISLLIPDKKIKSGSPVK